ncbi:zinc finger and SCAN domain-containing protein 5B [Puntigrus tetrazona]|uniref:zinc finger and SCAN domain-containing protein 5B n=1 Tax=Puntigrus tetrazona TaxID=1606681 RepID=UPI001C8A2D7C|nr:zinc finger and SCAN domain-containing protein 5B [Puntigrus tetrazona]
MSQMELLVTNVAELLTAAVQEVLQLMGQAVFEYQKESARTRLENQTLQQKLKQLQQAMTGDSNEVLKASLPIEKPHLEEDHAQEDLIYLGDSAVNEQSEQPQCPNDNPVHMKMVLDEITLDSRHHTLQGTCDYSLKKQRPLSGVKRSPPKRIPNSFSGESPATSNAETPPGSNRIKDESKPEPLDCSVTEETDAVRTQAPVVLPQDVPPANEHNQLPVLSFPNSVVHYDQLGKLLTSASKHILRSRVENMVQTGGVHGTPSVSESREILHSCHVCGKSFATPSSLGAHFVCHSNERPFVCKCCKFRFSRLADLKKHERIHTGERPYNCSLCGRRFNRTENLRRHLRKIHYGAVL